ncbi:ATP-binding protein [Epilithonimonas sp. JDS]|uniref:sensor histidine kinase n=1 Tax=Epilithonimonas sp. JDS TaxID=2902797 RepID=UPI001E53F94C|nr:HAMP domain-containing sensor histidine kinase [Epilithonimonas sp. JDS]MCD9856819.1 ATP-binding protein [Epilithonimonas sp. JDS]
MLTRILCMMLFISVSYQSQKFSSRWYTTDNGLPQNSIKDIVKDKYGFLWMSTENGILKYDGNSFETFSTLRVKNLHFKTFLGSVANDHFYILNDEEKDGVVISQRTPRVVTAKSDMREDTHFLGEVYRRYTKRNITEPTPEERYAVKMDTGSYFLSHNLILYKSDGSDKVLRLPVRFSTRDIKNVFVHGETLFVPDAGKKRIIKIKKGIVSEEKNSVYSDRESIIYYEEINHQVFVINKDEIFISRYTGGKLSLKKLMTYNGFGNFQFYSMYYDESYNTLYLGSLTKGLNIVRPYDFSVVKKNMPYKDDVFYTSLPVTDSEVVVPDGYIYNNKSLVKKYAFDEDNYKNTLLYDEHRNIICFAGKELHKYEFASDYRKRRIIRKDFKIENILKCQSKYFITQRRNDDYLLMLYDDSTFAGTAHIFKFKSAVSCISYHSKNHFLIGNQEGLFVMDINTYKIRPFGSFRIGVKNMCRTKDGRLWIISFTDGLFLLEDQKLVKLPLDEDGNIASSHHLMEDTLGNFWIPTNNGLYRTSAKALLRYVRNRNTAVHYYRYSTMNGLTTNEFNGRGIPGAISLLDGNFVLPSMDGLVFFRPDLIPSYYPKKEEIFINRIKVNDAITSFRHRVVLDHDFVKAEFFIDLPYFSDNDNLQIEARVKNSKKSWTRVVGRRYIFSKKTSGESILQIRILTSGSGTYYYKSIPVYVIPMFYETKWFIALCTGMLIILVIILIWWRTKRLIRKVNRKKQKIAAVQKDLFLSQEKLKNESQYAEQFFQAITHDISTPIRHLSNLSHMMATTGDQDLQRKYFDSLHQSTEELYKMTLSLREYRNVFNENTFGEEATFLREIVELKISLFREVAKYNDTELINNIPPETQIHINKNALSIIIQNVLDNALKHTSSGRITFESKEDQDYIQVIISDTGVGMAPDQLSYFNTLYKDKNEASMQFNNTGLGIQLILRLLKKTKSSIDFLQNEPSGTIIIMKFKRHV